jgi:hypothetical protein
MFLPLLLLLTQIASCEINFVAVGDDVGANSYNIAYSQNGIDWISVTDPIFNVEGASVAYGQGVWIAVGANVNTMARSTDGINWVGLGTSIFTANGRGICYSPEQDRWVAVGNGGNIIAYSNDSTTWTPVVTSVFSIVAYDVVYGSGVDRWVAVGSFTNSIAYSPDGMNWFGAGNIAGARYGVGYSPVLNQFITTGQVAANNIAVSPDGMNWTPASIPIDGNVMNAYYAENIWLVMGQSSTNPAQAVVDSTDGTTFDIQYSNTTILTNVYGVVYNSAFDRWVMGGFGPSSMVYSSDGFTWMAGTDIFSTGGGVVATTNTNVIDPPYVIDQDVTSLIIFDGIIPFNATLQIVGNLSVNGDLIIDGHCTFVTSGNIVVSNATFVNNITSYVFDYNITSQSISLQTKNLIINANVAFRIYLLNANVTQNRKRADMMTLELAQYESHTGEYDSPIIYTCPSDNLDDCEIDSCSTSVSNYDTNVLTLTITLQTGCGGEVLQGTPQVLSIYAIIGIAVGCALAAIVAMTIFGVVVRRTRMARAKQRAAMLRQVEIEGSLARQPVFTP